MSQPKFVIVDGNAIVHRAYHAIPPLNTKEGIMVNAVYGFVSMMLKMLNDLKPEYIAVAFDVAGGTFRHKQFDKYKATRVKADQALYDQIPLVQEAVSAFRFPIYYKAGYEADDVIGTLVRSVENEPIDVYIVTGDMDTLQLVNDKVRVYTLKKGLSDIVIYDRQAVEERFGFGPEKMVDYKSLRGDASDNIPGVTGIGEKSATELIQKMGTLENIYSDTAKLKEAGIRESVITKLIDGKDNALLSKNLSQIDCMVPDLKFSLEDCRIKKFDREKIVTLFQKFEFISLLKRIPEFRDSAEELQKPSEPKTKPKKNEFNYSEIKEKKDLELIKNELQSSKSTTIRFITDNPDFFKANIIGIVLVFASKVFYIDGKYFKEVIEIITAEKAEVVGHDLKQIIKILELKEEDISHQALFDTMIASYILNPGSRAHDIPSLVLKVLGKELTAASGQESLFGLDKRQASYEAFLVSEIHQQLKKDLKKNDTSDLMGKIEMPLVPVLANMELNGVAVDKKALKELSVDITKQIKESTEKIYGYAGVEFNISSPLQLREILFEKMEIPTDGVKKGKTGLSTSAEELEKLKGQHPIIDEIGVYRELTKLQNTYIDTLPLLINPATHRIHSTFNQAVTATGRLSSSDPNLQNIPIRTELGKKIRNAFIAEKGYKLISADYSQIELRVVASLADDKKMIEIFNKDEDIHKATAAAIHGVPLEKVTKQMRYSAKEVNFGVLYGMGVYGLSWRADISRSEAKEFIDKYFSEFSGVKKYIDKTLAHAKTGGYCETLFGRRRYLPELNSTNFQVRSTAERMAINHPVQGTAADIIKLAMIEIHKEIKNNYNKKDARLILQVHDELVLEVKEKLADEIGAKIKNIMENVVRLKVPVKVEVAAGDTWGETK